MRRTLSVAALALFLLAVVFARAEVIDRIVAKVNGHIILQSDWDEALRFEALLNGKLVSQFNDADRRAVLDRLIDQELLGEQMKKGSFPHASESEVAARIAEARKLHPEGATDEGWQAVLAQFQLAEKDIAAHVRQDIDLARLVDAHLRPEVQIDSQSIENYYRQKLMPQMREAGAGDVALADVSGKIRELLTQEKVNELLVSWLQTLRSESHVTFPELDGQAEGVQSQ